MNCRVVGIIGAFFLITKQLVHSKRMLDLKNMMNDENGNLKIGVRKIYIKKRTRVQRIYTNLEIFLTGNICYF